MPGYHATGAQPIPPVRTRWEPHIFRAISIFLISLLRLSDVLYASPLCISRRIWPNHMFLRLVKLGCFSSIFSHNLMDDARGSHMLRAIIIFCIAEIRKIEQIASDEATTRFMPRGDTVRVEMRDARRATRSPARSNRPCWLFDLTAITNCLELLYTCRSLFSGNLQGISLKLPAGAMPQGASTDANQPLSEHHFPKAKTGIG